MTVGKQEKRMPDATVETTPKQALWNRASDSIRAIKSDFFLFRSGQMKSNINFWI